MTTGCRKRLERQGLGGWAQHLEIVVWAPGPHLFAKKWVFAIASAPSVCAQAHRSSTECQGKPAYCCSRLEEVLVAAPAKERIHFLPSRGARDTLRRKKCVHCWYEHRVLPSMPAPHSMCDPFLEPTEVLSGVPIGECCASLCLCSDTSCNMSATLDGLSLYASAFTMQRWKELTCDGASKHRDGTRRTD